MTAVAGRLLAFDTSFLVAAVLEPHAHHPRTGPWVQAIGSGTISARIAWHAVAETWSVLTRLPGTLQLAPATAMLVIDRLLERFQPIATTEAHYLAALRRCTEKGLRSGAVFDALHLVVAESETVEGLVTFNGGDFDRLRRERSPRIIVPPEPPGFEL